MKILALAPSSTLLFVLAACEPPDSEGPGTGTTEGAHTDTDGQTDTAGETEASSTATGEPTDTTAAEDTTTGAAPGSCGEATTPEQCAAASSEYADCGWFETTLVQDPIACAVTATSGVCLTIGALDGCDPSEVDDACAGLDGGWFVRTLEDGSVELLPDPHSCGGPGEFEACPWHEAGEIGDETLAAACACACMVAGG